MTPRADGTFNEIMAIGLPWLPALVRGAGSYGIVALDPRDASKKAIIVVPQGLAPDVAKHIAELHNEARQHTSDSAPAPEDTTP